MNSSTSVVSKAASIAQSTASQLDVKLKSNQTKKQLRQLMRSIDTGKFSFFFTFLICAEKTGIVKEDAFFTILQLHGILLPAEDLARLKKNHSRGGKINFKDALQEINVDLDQAILRE